MKPMLAAKTDGKALRYPVLASPKLDGVRALVLGGHVYSRTLKLIPNRHVQRLLGVPAFNGWDGELCVGPPQAPDVYRKTTSGVMSEDGEPSFCFYAFDRHDMALPFYRRIEALVAARGKKTTTKHVIVLPHPIIGNEEDLLMYEQDCLAQGYEGIMIRHPEGPYKNGRSTEREGWLMKLKRFDDSEAVVLHVVELMHNDNTAKVNALGKLERSSHKANKRCGDTMGALMVRDLKTGVEFDIGTGFDAETRRRIWLDCKATIGKIVKYKFFQGGVKDKPRFPVFLGFRDQRDC